MRPIRRSAAIMQLQLSAVGAESSPPGASMSVSKFRWGYQAMDFRAGSRQPQPDYSHDSRRPCLPGNANQLDLAKRLGRLFHGGSMGPARFREILSGE